MAGIEVDQMHEQPRSLGVTQESVPQPLALGRARNETRQIGDDERAVLVHPDDPESGLERRERIVGDLGLGRREPGDERGLARIREADYAQVGQQLELHVNPPLLAGPTQVGAARGAVGGGGEARIAATAAGAPGDQELLAGPNEITQQFARVAVGDHGAKRHLENRVGSALAVLVGALAVLAALGGVMALVVKVQEGRDGRIGLEDDAAAVAAVAAVRTASGNELLATEAHASGSPVSTLDEDVDLVNEHGEDRKRRQPRPR